MSQTLYLCEKPSQARDIASVLGAREKKQGYLRGPDSLVTWCIGHLLEQVSPESYDAAWKNWSLDSLPMIPARWRLEVRKDGTRQFACIKMLLQTASRVVLATDADREGETIGREVYWKIPNDYASMVESRNNGVPLMTQAPRAKVTKSIEQLAAQIDNAPVSIEETPEEERPKKGKSLFSFLGSNPR